MTKRKEEIRRLLGLYRRGGLDEELLLEQMADVQGNGDDGPESVDSADHDDCSPPRPDERQPLAPPEGEVAPLSDRGDSAASLTERLDAWRVAESSGSTTLAAWAEETDDDELGGGLRGAAARGAAHAELFERRLVDLGADPGAQLPEWMEKYNAALLDPSASDADRLAAVVAEFPSVEDAVSPLREFAWALQGDPLTRALLLSVCEDHVATLSWFHRAWQARRQRG
jgi:hypothetical protein